MAFGLTLACGASAQGASSVPLEKQALVNRVLAKMALDTVGVQMLNAPVAEMLRQSRVVVTSRIPAEKQEAVMKDLTAEAPLLAQKFSVEELRQLAELLESPVLAKFETLVPEMKKTVGDNVAKANAAQIQPKMTELQSRVGLRLRAAMGQP
jgi:5,10-methenyltetrahydromethanopterin hydrogenase